MMPRFVVFVVGSLLLLAIAAGCTTPQKEQSRGATYGSDAPPIVCPLSSASPSPSQLTQSGYESDEAAGQSAQSAVRSTGLDDAVETITFGNSVAGRPLIATIHGDGGHGETTILILATIHGNEAVGTPLVKWLDTYLTQHPEVVVGKRVILVPVANPDGMADRTRANHHGVDLNRNFPASNYTAVSSHGNAALSEPESRALHDFICKYAPSRIITLHQPLTCIDYDGPAEPLARAMAAHTRLPLKKLGGLAGSLGSFAGENRHIPVVTVEFSRGDNDLTAEGMWYRYGRMMLAGICYPDSPPSSIALKQPELVVSVESAESDHSVGKSKDSSSNSDAVEGSDTKASSTNDSVQAK